MKKLLMSLFQFESLVRNTADNNIQRVAVVGTGLMGHGIAQAFAVNGFDVTDELEIIGDPLNCVVTWRPYLRIYEYE